MSEAAPRTVFVLGEYGPAGRYHPTAHIRLLLPLGHPSVAGSLILRDGLRLPMDDVDCIVLERFWRYDVTLALAEEMVGEIRRRRARFLYAIDDNLVDLGRDEPWDDPVRSERRAAVYHFLRRADGVIVSTPSLAERLGTLHDRIVVLPPALDERLIADSRARLEERVGAPPAAPVVFGYMGTGTHTRDLMMVLEPLRAVLRRHRGEVELQLAGVTKDERARRLLAGLPVRFLDIPISDLYLDYVAWAVDHVRWDFAIAPLEDTPANRCKSDIKFLDYALLGAAGIYSRGDAYRTVEHESTGLLCGPDPADWEAALERMIADSGLCSRLALAAYDEVRPGRMLERRAHEWLNAIDLLCGEA
jgi:glycosyltransferase involved in cell wall biosynthesis